MWGFRSVLVAAALFLFVGPAAAQETASLRGYVRDASTGETLLQANVVVKETGEGTATNNAGYYTLSGLAPGTYTVVFSYIGFQTRTEGVTLEAGEERRLDVELTPAEVETDEVVVTGEGANEEIERQIGSDRLRTATITELPSVLQPDVFRSLSLLPGVTTASDYSSNLYIRGGGPDQTLVLLDGTTVYNPTHFFGFFSTFNPDAIKDVQLYKGAYPAEYGGRLGSVVAIYNKDGNRRATTGGLSVGLLASRAYVEGPYGGTGDDPAGSYMVAVRRSTLEPVLAVLRGTDADGIPKSFSFYDVNAKLNYDVGPDDKLSLSFYGGQDFLLIEPQTDTRFDVNYGNQTLSANWTHLFGDQVFSTVTLTGSRYRSTPVASIASTQFTQENGVRDLSLNADIEYTPNEHHTIKSGLRSSTLGFTLRETFGGTETFDQSITGQRVAVYAQDTYEPTSAWTLKGGLRGTYFSSGDFWRLSPRLSVDYTLTPSVQLQAAYGRYHQFLTLETSQLFTAFDNWLMSDTGVPPSSGDQVALGVKARLGAGINLEVEGYGRTMRNLFEQDPRLVDPAGVPYPERFRFGDGRAYGLEVLLRRQEGALSGFLSYTLSRTERRFPNVRVSERGEPQYYPPNYDRTHSLTLAVTYALSDHWTLSSTFNYNTGKAYTRPQLRYERVDSPFQSSSQRENVFISPFNGARLPAYHRLDVGVARTGRFFGIADYKVQLQAINAYARRNTWFYQYNTEPDGTIERTETPQIPVPIPNLALTLTF
ncbi:MAG: TonB-dependent receptor domain-containing protein [Salinibacter sp.]